MQSNSAFNILPGDANYQPPQLDSMPNILLVINQIFRAQLARKIDLKESKFYLQLIGTALRVMKEQAREAAKATPDTAIRNARVTSQAASNRGVVAPVPQKPPHSAANLDAGVFTDPYGCFTDYNQRTRAENAAKAQSA
jgi:hypothetical protein